MGRKDKLPGFNNKQKLLFGKSVSKETLVAVAESFFEAGQMYDSLEFFAKAGDEKGLDKIREAAIAEADPVLLKLVSKKTGESISSVHWRRLGENALSMGKKLSAEEAFRMAGDWKAVSSLKDNSVKFVAPEPEGEEDEEDDDGLDD